jgi:hypothetical protein
LVNDEEGPYRSRGIYVLDGFGGVFVLGSTRIIGPNDPTPKFYNGVYFFPYPIVRDLEPTYRYGVSRFQGVMKGVKKSR